MSGQNHSIKIFICKNKRGRVEELLHCCAHSISNQMTFVQINFKTLTLHECIHVRPVLITSLQMNRLTYSRNHNDTFLETLCHDHGNDYN